MHFGCRMCDTTEFRVSLQTNLPMQNHVWWANIWYVVNCLVSCCGQTNILQINSTKVNVTYGTLLRKKKNSSFRRRPEWTKCLFVKYFWPHPKGQWHCLIHNWSYQYSMRSTIIIWCLTCCYGITKYKLMIFDEA